MRTDVSFMSQVFFETIFEVSIIYQIYSLVILEVMGYFLIQSICKFVKCFATLNYYAIRSWRITNNIFTEWQIFLSITDLFPLFKDVLVLFQTVLSQINALPFVFLLRQQALVCSYYHLNKRVSFFFLSSLIFELSKNKEWILLYELIQWY